MIINNDLFLYLTIIKTDLSEWGVLATAVDVRLLKWHTIHMKRTNLVLDENLLKDATRLLGAKTYSAAVNTALEETIRVLKIRGLLDFFGKDIWDGNLSDMRDDQPVSKKSKNSKRK